MTHERMTAIMQPIATLFAVSLGWGAVLASAAAAGPALSIPLACDPDRTCLIQQYVDMAPGPEATDPFCGTATYDDHKGTDFRVLSLKEMAKGVSVLAVAGGTVLRLRDGEADRLIQSVDERAGLQGKECGNGLVIDQGDGWTAQYCHLRANSIRTKAGQNVRTGEPLGLVGSSGFSQFPHLHLTVRRKDRVIDPASGREMGTGCVGIISGDRSLWSIKAQNWMSAAGRSIIDVGLTGELIDHDQLVETGAPPSLVVNDTAIVGWGWFANLHKNDQVRIRIVSPRGATLIDTVSDPLPQAKASYSRYAGRKRLPEVGRYSVTVDLLRNGEIVETRTEDILAE